MRYTLHIQPESVTPYDFVSAHRIITIGFTSVDELLNAGKRLMFQTALNGRFAPVSMSLWAFTEQPFCFGIPKTGFRWIDSAQFNVSNAGQLIGDDAKGAVCVVTGLHPAILGSEATIRWLFSHLGAEPVPFPKSDVYDINNRLETGKIITFAGIKCFGVLVGMDNYVSAGMYRQPVVVCFTPEDEPPKISHAPAGFGYILYVPVNRKCNFPPLNGRAAANAAAAAESDPNNADIYQLLSSLS